MPTDRVLLDEWHVQFFIDPRNPDVTTIRRILHRSTFRRRLQRRIRRMLRRHPRLATVSVTLTR